MKTDVSPTARSLLALELVQSNPGITADRLADKLGVSERAARRYVGILREAGMPIDSVTGPYGGYRLGRGLRLPPLMFSADEALALVMAVLDGHHRASDPTDVVGSALGKIVRALPEQIAAQAEAVRVTAAPAPDRAAARPDPTTTSVLVHACSTHRRVRLHYCSEAGSTWASEVEPWAIVVRHGRWYLLCHSLSADARRAYRIDRVRGVEVLDDTFSTPNEFDPVELLEEHLAVGWEYQVDIVIEAAIERVRSSIPSSIGRLEAIDATTTRLFGTTSNPAWYVHQLSDLPVPFRIVSCPELQDAARALGQRLVAASGSTDVKISGDLAKLTS